MNAEEKRLQESRDRRVHWKRWGPYLSDRQWGTVREAYSPYGTAWEFFPYDHARSRAYRWGEDGILGLADRHGGRTKTRQRTGRLFPERRGATNDYRIDLDQASAVR